MEQKKVNGFPDNIIHEVFFV